MKRISLIMATVGRAAEVERFIHSLEAQSCRRFELIVVDQNRNDRLLPLVERARKQGLEVSHLKQAYANLCLARNTGLSHAHFDLVAFPDDDCWYQSDVVERVLTRMDAMDRPDGVLIRWIEQDPDGQRAHIVFNRTWRNFRSVPASSITQFLRRDLVAELGGFDPAFGLHSWFGGGEETELMFRVMAAGAVVAYVPDAIVHHTFTNGSARDFNQSFTRARSRSRGTGGLWAKHKLSAWVIARGLVSPWMKLVTHLHQPAYAVTHLGTAMGRLEGYVRWKAQRNQR